MWDRQSSVRGQSYKLLSSNFKIHLLKSLSRTFVEFIQIYLLIYLQKVLNCSLKFPWLKGKGQNSEEVSREILWSKVFCYALHKTRLVTIRKRLVCVDVATSNQHVLSGTNEYLWVYIHLHMNTLLRIRHALFWGVSWSWICISLNFAEMVQTHPDESPVNLASSSGTRTYDYDYMPFKKWLMST